MKRALVLALLVAPLLAAPPAAAHAVPADFAIVPFDGPIPFEGARNTTILFDYRCSGMTTAESDPNMSVRFVVDSAPAWARLTIEPAQMLLEECRGVGQARATITGAAVPDSTGLGESIAVVRAVWTTAGFELDSTAQLTLKPPFVAAFDVDAPLTEITSRPQTPVVFPVTFTSRATGVMKLTFEVVEKVGGVQVPVPLPITLQGPDGLHRSATVPFTFQTPYKNGPNDDRSSVTMRITPHNPFDPRERGDPQEITFVVNTKGMYVPGPQFFGAMLAVAVAALLLRRR